jgi:hypothetical protein
LLKQLEQVCRLPTAKPRKVWLTLRRLGEAAGLLLSQASVLRMAESLTIFADFPLGLAIPAGATAPLQCVVPLSYRPVSPLAGALEYELTLRCRML